MTNVIALPKRRPKGEMKAAPQDQRAMAVVPIRAIGDKRLTHQALQVLIAIGSYTNRAGLTWVSQHKIAADMKVFQQAVNRQVKLLKELGYLREVSKACPGVKGATLQLVFDPSISAEDAVALTSRLEDTRPPEMRAIDHRLQATPKTPERDFSDEEIQANKERINTLFATLGKPTQRTHQPQRIGDLMAPKKKRDVQHPGVVNREGEMYNNLTPCVVQHPGVVRSRNEDIYLKVYSYNITHTNASPAHPSAHPSATPRPTPSSRPRRPTAFTPTDEDHDTARALHNAGIDPDAWGRWCERQAKANDLPAFGQAAVRYVEEVFGGRL